MWSFVLLVASGWGHCPQVFAQSGDGLVDLEQQAFQAAVARAADYVVQVETFGGLERVGKELVAEGPTTGTILAPDGWIISSLFSFRQQPASILVTLPEGGRVPAKVVARDYSRELALLKVEGQSNLPFAQPADLNAVGQELVGSWALALGKTYSPTSVSQSIGIISAVGRGYGRAIQTDAKISPINYGGPLLNLQGRALGILAPISPGAFFDGDSSQLYDSGIGFAIPLTDILSRLPRMQKGEDIRPGKLGIASVEQNEFAGPVEVAGALPGSPAAKAGVRPGDILIEAGGEPVQMLAHLRHALGPVDAGQPFSFAVRRDGQRVDMQTELMAELPVYRRRFLGLRLRPADQGGLEITAIEPNSPASQTELQVGQRLTACDGQRLTSPSDLRNRIAVAELDRPLVFQVTVDDGPPREVEILATTWPGQLPPSIPEPDARIQDPISSTVVDINIGDFPNQAYAVIPPLADQRTLGLLLVFPEPGALDRDKTQAHWEEFGAQYGWIVAVLNSGNPRGWSMEEMELAGRIVGRMQKGYTIDPARTVFGGLGVGGRMALFAATLQRDKVSAVLAIGTELQNARFNRQRNAPLQSLDYLLIGAPEPLREPAERLEEEGFVTTVLPAMGIEPQKWETHPQSEIEFWLEGLARF